MHRINLLFVLMVCACASLSTKVLAQAYRFAPPTPRSYDAAINRPGATINDVIDSMHAYLDPADTNEGGALDQLESFEKYWTSRVTHNDTSGYNMFTQYLHALRKSVLEGEISPCVGDGQWEPIGPDRMGLQADGYLNALWGDPANAGYILAGSEYSGLWKTTDSGANWDCITDNAPLAGGAMGVTNIEVNPLNKNTIFLGTKGAGILESFDAGNTWQQEFIPQYHGYADTVENVQGVYFTPDSTRLYAFTNDSFYTRYNVGIGNVWINITPAGFSGGRNLKFVPGNQDHFFISNFSYYNAGIWYSTAAIPTSPANWSKITAGLTTTISTYNINNDSLWRQFALSIPESDTLFFSAQVMIERANLYKYSISGNVIQEIYHDLPRTGDDRIANKGELIVTPRLSNNNNQRNIYYGWDVPYQSFNSGTSFTQIGEYLGSPTHGDIRCMYLQHGSNTLRGAGDRLYFATDGGISKKPVGVDISISTTLSNIDISGHGLYCGTFNGFSTGEAGGLGLGSMMHDGIVSYDPDNANTWKNLVIADAWTSAIDKSNPLQGYSYYGFNGFNIEKVYSSVNKLDAAEDFDTPPSDDFPVGPPIETDASGKIYVVEHNFYEKDPGSTFGVPNTTPPAYGFPNSPNLLGASMALDPNASSFTGYVLYNGPTQAIYYRNPSDPLALNAVATSSVTASDYFPVTSITTDRRNTERVWVSQGAINYNNSDTAFYRVQYSSDHGQTWIDISAGLPQHVAATAVVYDETKNMLYCATDAGVFHCDFSTYDPNATQSGLVNHSVIWTCFSNGKYPGHDFPNTSVSRLQINHCQSKLYATTYGRSIWATDINNAGDIVDQGDTITTNTTWNTNKYIYGAVVVTTGHTLTIQNDTVYMPRSGVIVVEKGAKLIVDHSVITNDCQGCQWFGIEALGDKNLPQSPASNQGWVIFKNNSVISHARYAVSNYDLWNGDLNTTGGIIQATNTNFVNNHRGATFAKYHNYHSGFLYPNVSSFLNDSFFLDNDYRGIPSSYAFTSHIFMEEVEGISVRGGYFLNRNTNNLNRGDGIASHNAGFSVANSCPSLGILNLCLVPYIPCYFNGFANGIYISKDISLDPTITINNAHFDSVSVGIDINGANSVSALNNVFTVGHGLYTYEGSTYGDCYQNIGILTNNANSFHIEGNAFTGIATGGSPTLTNIGVAVENSGINDKRVQGNNFTNLDIGCYAYGKNGLPAPYASLIFSGLEYRCNTYSSNTNSILVNASSDTDGISPHQGNVDTASGNTFIPNITSSCSNNNHPIYYCYNGANSYPHTFSGSVIPEPDLHANLCGNSLIYHNNTYTNGTLDVGAYNTLKTAHASLTTALSDSTNAYNSIIDEGNTTHVLGLISGVLTTGYTQLYDTLAKISPFLSPQVLHAALIDSTVFSKSQRWNLWNSNHEAATYLPVDPAYSSFPVLIPQPIIQVPRSLIAILQAAT